jgi:hypothetical protein
VELIELGDYKFLFFDGNDYIAVDIEYLSKEFPAYTKAVIEFVEREQFLEANQFISVAAYTLIHSNNKKKRYEVYRRLAWAAGYVGRTQYPPELEEAIKSTWSDPGETFTGFIEA